jgi:hypothetical protein
MRVKMDTWYQLLISLGFAVWVYLDAKRLGIQHQASGKFLDFGPIGWSVFSGLIWVVAFPLYLRKRGSVSRPDDPKWLQVGSWVGYFFLITLIVVVAVSGSQGKGLPPCEAKETASLLEQIVNDLPLVKATNTRFVSLKQIEELGYNNESELRSCKATLITTAGQDDLQYSIKWQDKRKGLFYVEARLQ